MPRILFRREGLVVVLLWSIGGYPAAAQTDQSATPLQPGSTATAAPAAVPAFNSARTPTSPAFTLFGLEPASVERPANPSDLALAFASQAKNAASVPEDFAVEFSPFWLVSQPSLTWSNDEERGVWASLQRTASFSVGTGEIGTSDASVRGLALGGRASLFSGRLSAETKSEIQRLERLLTAEASLALQLMASQLKELNRMLLAKEITKEEHARLMGALQASTLASAEYRGSAERKAVEKLMQRFATVRNGFFLEVAGAAGWRYPDAIWSQGRFDRWGLWVTPSFLGKSSSVVGVLRYLSEDPEAGTEDGVLDYGVRGIHFRDRYAVSVEYVRRTFRAADLTGGHRFVGIAEYSVTDGTWFVATFGRDANTEREGSLVARLGLSFNFTKERYLADSGPPAGGGRNTP